jgi:hypothetical protein
MGDKEASRTSIQVSEKDFETYRLGGRRCTPEKRSTPNAISEEREMNDPKGHPMSLPNAKDDARQRDVASVEERVAELQRAQRQESVEGFMDGGRGMRLPDTAHTSRPWRIHEFTRDFRLEDVWALPTPGGPGDFPRLVRQMSSGGPSFSGAARALWELRWKIGELLGWDDPDAGLGSRVPTLRDRLPRDLRDAPSGPDFDTVPFTSLYLLDDEFAAEMANRTVYSVMHLGWVPDGTGGYRGQMAVLVKPNGLFGAAYMAAIKPFRYLIVYPALMRQIEREWRKPTHEPR